MQNKNLSSIFDLNFNSFFFIQFLTFLTKNSNCKVSVRRMLCKSLISTFPSQHTAIRKWCKLLTLRKICSQFLLQFIIQFFQFRPDLADRLILTFMMQLEMLYYEIMIIHFFMNPCYAAYSYRHHSMKKSNWSLIISNIKPNYETLKFSLLKKI